MEKKVKPIGKIDYPNTVGVTPEGKQTVLSVRNLEVSFRTDEGKVHAVRGVSFDLYKGETLCIVGESGSGKSVTSKTIMGILGASAHIDSGHIIYQGEDLTKISEEEFHRIRGTKIGMVFQDPLSSLNPIMKIGKQITEVMIINGNKVKRIKSAITDDALIAYKNDLRLLSLAKEEYVSAKKDKSLSKEDKDALKEKYLQKRAELYHKCEEDKKTLRMKKKEAFFAARKFKKDVAKEHHQKEKLLLSRAKQFFFTLPKAGEEEINSAWASIYNPARKAAIEKLKAEYAEIFAKEGKTAAKENEFKEKKRELQKKYASKETLGTLYGDFISERRRYISELRVTHKDAKRRALKVMAEVGIADPERRFNQYPFEFSGGMRQRIVIAIALTADPEILICDEPTTALDVTIQAQILELINRLKDARHMSVIFITHDLGVVANMADRVAVMYAGKIVEYGTAEDVFYHPAHPYTWALLSSIPDIDSKERLEAIPGTPPNMLFPPKGDAFALRSKYALGIDFKEEPPMFQLTDTHYAATWLLDERAPEAKMPSIVATRIRNSLKEGGKQDE